MADQNSRLSKSTFIRGLQCLKSLYLHKNRPFLRDRLSPDQLAKFKRGHTIGDLAQSLFPGGILGATSGRGKADIAISRTKTLIEKGQKHIYEAAFMASGVYSALDILVRENDSLFAYEVKSSLAISETYLWDGTLQYWVMQQAGFQPDDFRIIYVNKDYVFNSPFNPHEYFCSESILGEIQSRLSEIPNLIREMNEAAMAFSSPSIMPDYHCYQPYACDFIGHCHKNLPKPSILDLWKPGDAEAYEYFSNRELSISSLMNKELKPEVKCRFTSATTNMLCINARSLSERLRIVGPPTYIQLFYQKPALPFMEGSKPYDPVLNAVAMITSAGDSEMYWIDQDDYLNSVKKISQCMDNSTAIIFDQQETFNHFFQATQSIDLFEIVQIGDYFDPHFLPWGDRDRIRNCFHKASSSNDYLRFFEFNARIAEVFLSPNPLEHMSLEPLAFKFTQMLREMHVNMLAASQNDAHLL